MSASATLTLYHASAATRAQSKVKIAREDRAFLSKIRSLRMAETVKSLRFATGRTLGPSPLQTGTDISRRNGTTFMTITSR
jgi:hypothetical protein